MTRFSRSKGSLCAVLGALLFTPAFLGCGGSTADDSTDTGNPPFIDELGISVVAEGDAVVVSAGPGAVSPGGADVSVTNQSTGASGSTTAGADGSFEVQVDGGVEDDYRVTVTANGETTTVDIPAGGASGGLDLVGRTFLLDSSEGFTPVADTTVRLWFEATEFGFSAGCNSHFGDYSICDEKLCATGLGSTEIGCDAALSGQDGWLSEFFTSTPSLSRDGASLTISNAGATLDFLDREVADPDRPLVGPLWTVDTFIQGQAATNFGMPSDPTLEFLDDGTLAFDTGCNAGSADYEVNGNEIVFSGYSVTEIGCGEPASTAEAHILQIVAPGTVTFEIEAARLTITRGDVGIMARTD